MVLGGTQDNGTLWTDSDRETADWEEIYGGDGAYCSVIDVATGHYLVSYYFANTLQIVVDESGALLQETTLTPETDNNFLFINAALADPADEKVLYLASDQGVMRNSGFHGNSAGKL